MSEFPQLKGEATSGKVKLWSIRVIAEEDTGIIETTHGYDGGKMQVAQKVISEGKNIGKKNETTPLQQAIQEAKAAWVKKTESGYSPVTEISEDEMKEEDEEEKEEKEGKEGKEGKGKGKGIDDSVPSPMLAHDYHKRGKSIVYPCYAQKKYDGVRCIAIPGQGLFSRLKKKFPHMEHIIQEINTLLPGTILDGELYSDTLTFQEIVGLVKRETLKKGDAEKQLQIKFHVYDIVNSDPYEKRWATLMQLFRRPFKHLVEVQSQLCESEDKMKELHAQYVQEGFEGIMLRNKKGVYANHRSADLQKYKEFFDTECEIVGFKEGEGLEEGCVLWICKTEENKVFSCRPRGSREERQVMFKNGKSYVGKLLTVRYQEKTDEGLLRFPVGISIRDYE